MDQDKLVYRLPILIVHELCVCVGAPSPKLPSAMGIRKRLLVGKWDWVRMGCLIRVGWPGFGCDGGWGWISLGCNWLVRWVHYFKERVQVLIALTNVS